MKDAKVISSLKELQLLMPRILQQHGENQELTLLALANPILALKKAGYSLTAEAEEEIEANIRFGKEGAATYINAKKEMVALTKNVNLFRSKEALADGIEKYLSKTVREPEPAKTKNTKAALAKTNVSQGKNNNSLLAVKNAILQSPQKIKDNVNDPLSDFAKLNPIVTLLLQVRSLDASSPFLANEQTIGGIIEKAKQSPLQQITFRLNRQKK